MEMKLSIIVPVYNMAAGGKLETCLNSLLAQDIEDMEVIAVDDKSTDDSLQILQAYSQQNKKLKVVASSENRRQGGAKNLGLRHAAGEWVGFVDSDDWVSKDMFAKLLNKAEQTGADVVGCDYLLTDTTGKAQGKSVTVNTPDQTGILGEQQRKALLFNPGSMVVKIYKRALFTEHEIWFPEKMFYEDNAIAVLPLLYAARFERVEEPLYFYYQNPSSTVHTVNIERCHDRTRAMQIYEQECRSRGFYEKYREEITYKIFELGYRNTLFSYLQGAKHPSVSFVRDMKDYLLTYAPDIEDNAYYQQNMDAENKKMTALHKKSPLLFLTYYKLLTEYRRLRYRK